MSVTTRYARAFADVVGDRKLDAAKVLGELHNMVEMLESSSDLREVLESPSIPAEQKRNLLDAIVQRVGSGRETRNFFAVLIDHGRIPFLAQIARQVEHELNERTGVAEAEIVSARELSLEERSAIEKQVASVTGKQRVAAKYAVDGSLLGGVQVRVGSTVYDGSVRGQLHRLREQLVAE